MISKEIEALIKNTLSQYAQDFNTLNHEDEDGNLTGDKKIDFNVTFSRHVMDPDQIEGYDPEDPKFEAVTKYSGRALIYLRIVKIFLLGDDTDEKRVIYTGYRPVDEFKDKESMKKSLLMEALKNLLIGGLEYSEAIYRMNEQKEQEEHETIES